MEYAFIVSENMLVKIAEAVNSANMISISSHVENATANYSANIIKINNIVNSVEGLLFVNLRGAKRLD